MMTNGVFVGQADIDALGRSVAVDIVASRPFRAVPLPDGPPLAASYAVQDAMLRARLSALPVDGEALAGWKLAFNSAESMARNGLHEPCIAPVLRVGLLLCGGALRADAVLNLVVEPEFCLELGADLPPDGKVSPDAARAALRAVRPAIELMDHRGAFAQGAPAAQAVAQGIWNIGAVLGRPSDVAVLEHRRKIVTELRLDGERVAAARDAAPQDPIEGLVWAARALAARGWQLRAGMILLCGTHLPVQAVDRPCDISVKMGPLGEVAFSLV